MRASTPARRREMPGWAQAGAHPPLVVRRSGSHSGQRTGPISRNSSGGSIVNRTNARRDRLRTITRTVAATVVRRAVRKSTYCYSMKTNRVGVNNPRVLEVGRGSGYPNPENFSSDRVFTAEMV